MRCNLYSPIILFSAILVSLFLVSAASAFAFQGLQVGMEAPDFTLKSLDGSTRRFQDLRGEKLTVVIFWSTWSSKSEALLARMEKLYREKRVEGLSVIAINVDEQRLTEQTLDEIRKRVARQGISYPVLLDEGLNIFHDFGVIALPSTLLLDRDRTVKYELSGYPLMQSERMVEFICDTLAGKKSVTAAAVGHQPTKVAARFFNMGKNSLKSKRTVDDAENWFKKAIAADPEFILPRLSLASWYLRRGALPLARQEYEQVLVKEPDNVVALCEMGMVLVNEGKGTEGEKLLLRARQTEEGYAPCYYYAGFAYGKSGRLDDAEKMFAAALQANPRDMEIFAFRGRLYEEAGNQLEAASSYRKALETVLGIK